jgi:hypothetical protein
MRHSKPQPIRNKLDLTDRTQVRLVKRRLGLSDTELAAIVGRVGNSLSAISKEAATQGATVPPILAEAPPATVIAPTTVGEQRTAELVARAPAS